MMEEKQYEYKGLAYRMESIDDEFRFYIPYRNFTSEWYNGMNSEGLMPEKAAHKAARWLIDVYVG